MAKFIQELVRSASTLSPIVRFLFAILLIGQVWLRLFKGNIYRRKIIEHMVSAGPNCFAPVILVGACSAAIFAIHTARELSRFGAINIIGGAFALGFCRELAPILTACIVAGQVGSANAAEIGAMKVTEQIDALWVLRTDPIEYLVLPRVIACCLMLPILIVFALIIGIGSGVLTAAHFYQLSPTIFLDSVRNFLEFSDLVAILLKGVIFGATIAIIACSWGLTTIGGVKQVGQSATAAVVTTWISIFIIDFLLSLLLFGELVV